MRSGHARDHGRVALPPRVVVALPAHVGVPPRLRSLPARVVIPTCLHAVRVLALLLLLLLAAVIRLHTRRRCTTSETSLQGCRISLERSETGRRARSLCPRPPLLPLLLVKVEVAQQVLVLGTLRLSCRPLEAPYRDFLLRLGCRLRSSPLPGCSWLPPSLPAPLPACPWLAPSLAATAAAPGLLLPFALLLLLLRLCLLLLLLLPLAPLLLLLPWLLLLLQLCLLLLLLPLAPRGLLLPWLMLLLLLHLPLARLPLALLPLARDRIRTRNRPTSTHHITRSTPISQRGGSSIAGSLAGRLAVMRSLKSSREVS